jgi:hypothetical protein
MDTHVDPAAEVRPLSVVLEQFLHPPHTHIGAAFQNWDGLTKSQEIADQELVRRLLRGDPNAFEVLYGRHDSAVLHAVKRVIHGQADREHRAREVADFMWLELFSHPEYLSRHDYARRPLRAYLTDLARRKARRLAGEIRAQKEKRAALRLEGDLVDPTGERTTVVSRWEELWEQLMGLLSAKDRARLRGVLGMIKETRADQRWRERLVHKLRKQLKLE